MTRRTDYDGGDTDTIVKIRTPKGTVAWRVMFTALLGAIGYGQYFVPPKSSVASTDSDVQIQRLTETVYDVSKVQLPRLGESLTQLNQAVALLRQSTEERNKLQNESNRDHENRLRRIERTPLQQP